MATWGEGTEDFVCPGCGAKYRAAYKDYPERDRGSFHCRECKEEVVSWSSSRDYFEFTLIASGSKPAK